METIRCLHCGEPEYIITKETGTITSRCICESKRIKCDKCSHIFLRKDISFTNLYLTLCKKCNHDMSDLDELVEQYIPISHHSNQTMLCVEIFDEQLQLTISDSTMGMCIIFPLMTKKRIISLWLKEIYPEKIENLFNTAVLRLIPAYITKSEILSIKKIINDEIREGENYEYPE
ncbi:hypothetical protein [Paenibacillus terrae]|uniref:Uncharacterized protein n=1 Tax=Paenibacillus terrae TaxID=159743 RepID=A0A0D7WUU9_9BACL|nr:hypothetical protein [Paenibacillus terrae]KJD42945.1 hypothetical protein QD47_25340 [Paenibacillus terrae]